ncbi:hypothetical protein scyTo_0012611 [Scyliorhinus torazame]|uniref:Aspartyl/asparaginy/proline hydroxylase domain-containing protein n=1 Tax=Scyliorhinus torazame TaxID=75743 RepID=A0A401NGD1_SCYTO|nr:hypothetical protein [Scyliorhinus torazame]
MSVFQNATTPLYKLRRALIKGLKVPSSCELVVGGEPQCWAEGRCLLFDDSFLHTAFHGGPSEEGPRVVFMIDLWHPNIAATERQALDFIFSPGR